MRKQGFRSQKKKNHPFSVTYSQVQLGCHSAKNWAAKGFRTWGILRWKEKIQTASRKKISVIIYNRLGLHLGILLEHLRIQHVSSPWDGQNPEETSVMWLLALMPLWTQPGTCF